VTGFTVEPSAFEIYICSVRNVRMPVGAAGVGAAAGAVLAASASGSVFVFEFVSKDGGVAATSG
jgi:hypothetical protein